MKSFRFRYALPDGGAHYEEGTGRTFSGALACANARVAEKGITVVICDDCVELENPEMARKKISNPTPATEDNELARGIASNLDPAPAVIYPDLEEVPLDSFVAPSLPDASPPTQAEPTARSMWGVIVDTIVTIDVEATYKRLTAELQQGHILDNYGALAAALEIADRNAFEAAKLERAAKLEQERVDANVERDMEILRTEAAAELEAEKAAGKRSKAPTIQDIKDRVVAKWPEHSEKLTMQTREIHAVRSVCESLTAAWKSRAATLRTLAERYAPTRTI